MGCKFTYEQLPKKCKIKIGSSTAQTQRYFFDYKINLFNLFAKYSLFSLTF